jgi:hypothetical protein
MQTALAAANTVNADADATQTAVNAARDALKAALEALEGNKIQDREGIDKKALRDLITAVNEKAEADYTPESWAPFAAALAAAKAVAEDYDAEQGDVDDAKAALDSAITGLAFKEIETGFGSTPVNPAIALDLTGTQAQYVDAAGKYGVEGAATLKYIIGDDGLYFYGEVRDRTLMTANADLELKAYDSVSDFASYMEDCDRVEMFIDTQGDGGENPQTDDLRVRLNLNGEMDIAAGNGSRWVPIGMSYGIAPYDYEPDYIAFAQISGANTIAYRDPASTELTNEEKDVDTGYKFELFFSYSRHNFSKRSLYFMCYGQADYVNAADAQIFNGVGNVDKPDEFFMLSQYGLGTDVALEDDINDPVLSGAFWSDAVSFETTRAYAGNDTIGTMTAVAKAKFGNDGLYIGIQTVNPKLVYGGPNNGVSGFGYKNDHVELRIDTNVNKASDDTDRFFFVDIASNRITMNGITTDTRSDGAFNYVLAMKYFGEVVNGYNNPVYNVGSAAQKGYVFKMYLSYAALGITKAAAQSTGIGLFAACGNPEESGIGCVFGDATNRADATITPYLAFDHYYNLKAA